RRQEDQREHDQQELKHSSLMHDVSFLRLRGTAYLNTHLLRADIVDRALRLPFPSCGEGNGSSWLGRLAESLVGSLRRSSWKLETVVQGRKSPARDLRSLRGVDVHRNRGIHDLPGTPLHTLLTHNISANTVIL
ncbi:MAG TPA: hypothetical protein PLO63_10905, partial [Syntrophales bacterium]|nr:hypothetical protein [Syntrophales bacterium]